MVELTVEDRLELHELYARFAHTYDSGDIEAWVALFTPDGWFGVPGAPLSGYGELRAFAERRRREAPGAFHLTTNIVLGASEHGATGRAYVLCLRFAGDGEVRLLNVGHYDDTFVRTSEGWRLAAREVLSQLAEQTRDAPFVFAPQPDGCG